jgi:transcriptional regulator with XRE-family HTH domain
VARPARKPALDPHLKAIGSRIRELREARKLSQDVFADLAGIDRSYVSGIERGVRNFGILLLFTIAKTLKVKPQDLLS